MSNDTELMMTRPTPLYKVGNTVQLNSGGPAMTVTTVQWDTVHLGWFCTCAWIGGTESYPSSDEFPEQCLAAWSKK